MDLSVVSDGFKIRGVSGTITANGVTPQSADTRPNKHPRDYYDDDSSDTHSQQSSNDATPLPAFIDVSTDSWLRNHAQRMYRCIDSLTSCHSVESAKVYATELRGCVCEILKDNIKLDMKVYELKGNVRKLDEDNEDLERREENARKQNTELNDKLVSLTKTKAGLACELDEGKMRAREVGELRNKHQKEVDDIEKGHEEDIKMLVRENNERVVQLAEGEKKWEEDKRELAKACS
ncbi:hypothetical protein B0T14DRAFT_238428 [Immersiella caudata]|uniref:Uncharacterized protein n=1 Tax=Immersiella caudata TaxID=314043 RepID=A0AA39WSN8_9PEZI|nr:hypothetical protein B0T14DRAFT_238428 [Immersiella caudata]